MILIYFAGLLKLLGISLDQSDQDFVFISIENDSN